MDTQDIQPGMSWRERHFPRIWALLLPLRRYLQFCPIHPGKGILLRFFLMPLLPPLPAEYELNVPGGGRVTLRYRETLGLSSLLYGTFELAELNFVARYLRPGDVALDIGANVGLFSVTMGNTVGKVGRVIAFEPAPANLQRLQVNLDRNMLGTVQVIPCALGNTSGSMMLQLASDPAFPSLVKVELGFADGSAVPVDVRRLDMVWEDAGRPVIALIKLDVEGAETDVIRGAEKLLLACHPTMIVEANSDAQLSALHDLLRPYGYRAIHPDGFAPHNHLFVHAAATANGRLWPEVAGHAGTV